MTSTDLHEVPWVASERIERLDSLIDLGAGQVAVMIHGVEQGAIFDLLQDGRIDSVKRAKRERGESDAFYLVADVEFEGIKVTLFTRDLPGGED